MANSKRYEQGALKKHVPYWLIIKRYWPKMLLTSGLWFVYDFISFPSSIFSSVIIDSVASGQPLIITVAWNLLLYSFYLPGSAGGAFMVDIIGRRKTLALGLFSMGVVGMIIGGSYEKLSVNCFPMFVVRDRRDKI